MGFLQLPTEMQNKILGLAIEEELDYTVGEGPKRKIRREDLKILHTDPELRRLAISIFADRVKLHASTGNVPMLKYMVDREILRGIKSLSLHTAEYSTGVKPFDYQAAQKTLRSLDTATAALLPRLQVLSIEIDLGYTHIAQVDYHFVILEQESDQPRKNYQTRTSIAQYVDASTSRGERDTKFRMRKKWTITQLPHTDDIEVTRELTTEHRDGPEDREDEIGRQYTPCDSTMLVCCHCFENLVPMGDTKGQYCTECFMSIYCSYACWFAGHRSLETHFIHGCAFSGGQAARTALHKHLCAKLTNLWGGREVSINRREEE